MKKIKMKAKFASNCNSCQGKIEEGSTINYLPDLKKAEHLLCPSKKAAEQASPAPKAAGTKEAVKETLQKYIDSAPKFSTDQLSKFQPIFEEFDEVSKKHSFSIFSLTDIQILAFLKLYREHWSDNPPF